MRDKYKPYVRRMRGGEVGASWREDYRIEFFKLMKERTGADAYVMVQRGFPNLVLCIAGSKEECKNQILFVGANRYTFKEWARGTKLKAQSRPFRGKIKKRHKRRGK